MIPGLVSHFFDAVLQMGTSVIRAELVMLGSEFLLRSSMDWTDTIQPLSTAWCTEEVEKEDNNSFWRKDAVSRQIQSRATITVSG